jgi:hypothetical protein
MGLQGASFEPEGKLERCLVPADAAGGLVKTVKTVVQHRCTSDCQAVCRLEIFGEDAG